MRYGCDTMGENFIMYHISPRKNRESILENGLLMDKDPSGFGCVPVYEAVYLMADWVRDRYMMDLVTEFYDVDVYFVEIPISEVATYGLPDEDSKEGTWYESLESHGTLCIERDILPSELHFWININTGGRDGR